MIEIILTSRADRRDVHEAERQIFELRDLLPTFAFAGTRKMGEAIVGFVVASGGALPPDGTLFRFPGMTMLFGEVRVGDVRKRSAISRVESVDGRLADDAVMLIDGAVRPSLESGEIVLRVTVREDGRYVPDDGYSALAASAAIVGYPRGS